MKLVSERAICSIEASAFFNINPSVLHCNCVLCGKEEKPPPDWNSEFGAIRTDKEKLLKDLRGQLAAEDWKGVMSMAREYDLSFRKG